MLLSVTKSKFALKGSTVLNKGAGKNPMGMSTMNAYCKLILYAATDSKSNLGLMSFSPTEVIAGIPDTKPWAEYEPMTTEMWDEW